MTGVAVGVAVGTGVGVPGCGVAVGVGVGTRRGRRVVALRARRVRLRGRRGRGPRLHLALGLLLDLAVLLRRVNGLGRLALLGHGLRRGAPERSQCQQDREPAHLLEQPRPVSPSPRCRSSIGGPPSSACGSSSPSHSPITALKTERKSVGTCRLPWWRCWPGPGPAGGSRASRRRSRRARRCPSPASGRRRRGRCRRRRRGRVRRLHHAPAELGEHERAHALVDPARRQVGLERAERARELGRAACPAPAIWLVWVSKPPQWIVMIRVPRLAPSRCAAIRRRVRERARVRVRRVSPGAAPERA